MNIDDERFLLTVSEAARLLSLSRSQTYSLVASGELPSLRVRTSIRVPRRALVEWVERRLTPDVR
jgi:excisionase family DNA binding protein